AEADGTAEVTTTRRRPAEYERTVELLRPETRGVRPVCGRGCVEIRPGACLRRLDRGGCAQIDGRRVQGRGRDTHRSARLCRCEVAREHGLGLRILVCRAELDELGSGRYDRDVPGRSVVGVAGLVDLVAVGVAKRHLPLQHITPVPALAAPVGQPGKE